MRALSDSNNVSAISRDFHYGSVKSIDDDRVSVIEVGVATMAGGVHDGAIIANDVHPFVAMIFHLWRQRITMSSMIVVDYHNCMQPQPRTIVTMAL